MLDGPFVDYAEKRVGHWPATGFGARDPLPPHATAMGKALLAFSSQDLVNGLIDQGLRTYTAYTLTSPDRLRRALAVIRLTRVAVSRWELEKGYAAVAVPVFAGGGVVVAALEVRVGDLRNDLPLMQPALVIAARCLSRDLVTRRPFMLFAPSYDRRFAASRVGAEPGRPAVQPADDRSGGGRPAGHPVGLHSDVALVSR